MQCHQDRRSFLQKGLVLAGTAGLLASATGAVRAQTLGPMRRSNRYDDTFIFERKPFSVAGQQDAGDLDRAQCRGLALRSRPVGGGVSPNPTNRVPDVINYAWREYGMRVGLWRIADVLDGVGVKATVALNSQYCETFPKAIEEMKKRGWEFMGHGTTNSESLAGLPIGEGKGSHPARAQDHRAGDRQEAARLARHRA